MNLPSIKPSTSNITNHDLDTNQLLNFFVLFSQEEEEEEGGQEEAWETSGLPPTPGGGEGTTAQQADGGARCYLLHSLWPEHWRQEV